MRRASIVEAIRKVVKSPMYGSEFYTQDQLIKISMELIRIFEKNEIGIEESDSKEEKIKKIKIFASNFVNIRSEYFDDFKGSEDYQYRTAYGALILKNAICTGYAELVCILLTLYDIKAHTMVATLPYRKEPAIHYFVVAEITRRKAEKLNISQ